MVLSRCGSGVSSSLQCERPFDEYANIITTGMCGTISAASCSGPDGRCGAAPVTSRTASSHSLMRCGAKGRGSICQMRFHSTLTLLPARDGPGRRARVGQHPLEHGRVKRALIE